MNATADSATRDRLEAVERRLEHVETLLVLALEEPLGALRKPKGLDDMCSATILRLTTTWIRAGELQAAVSSITGDSKRTVVRRIAALVKAGALEEDGTTANKRYRNTFLLG